MRPVDAQFPVSQEFGSYATAGVQPNPNGSEVQQLVAEYGNYQPFGHAGCDIACPIGTPVHAIADGTVLWADWGTNLPGDDSDAGYRQRWYLYKTFPGIVTLVQHDGWISIYAHLSEAPLVPGDRVTEGQQIGLSGNTRSPGVSLGAHLHVGAIVDLTYSSGNGLIYGCTDPEPFFGGTLTAQSSTITPLGGFLMALNDQDQQNIYEAQGRIDAGVAQILAALGKLDTIQARTANIPLDVLTAQFRTKAGAPIGVAAALGELLAKPSTVTSNSAPAAVDVDALVARLKAELPAAVLSELTSKLSK